MNTFLVVTDFSPSAWNATRYALGLAAAQEVCRIIIYNSYNPLFEPAATLPDVGKGTLDTAARTRMEAHFNELKMYIGRNSTLDLICDSRYFDVAVIEICREFRVGLVIAGAKDRLESGNLLIGTRLVRLVQNSEVPVMIIPETYAFNPVGFSVLASDLRAVDQYPIRRIGEALDLFQSKLMVLNIDSKEDERSASEQLRQIGQLHKLLVDLHPEFHYTNDRRIGPGILEFCKKHSAGLIILIYRERSIVYQLFNDRVSTNLVVNTDLPLLIIRAEPEN